MKKMNLRSIGLAVALGLGSIAMVGCTTTPKGAEASGPTARAAMDRDVDAKGAADHARTAAAAEAEAA